MTTQMRSTKVLVVTAIMIAALGMWAWQRGPERADAVTPPKVAPSVVEAIEGTEFSRVTLSQRAAERLDIQTADVRDETIDGVVRRVLPYSAVVYDPKGNAWTYTNPEPLVFIRHALTIDTIVGDIAILAEGPANGAKVVSVGGALLYGTEFGVGK